MPFKNAFGSYSTVECGLVTYDYERNAAPIPLKKVIVIANIIRSLAEVTVEQAYQNEESKPIEAVYLFPLDEGACVIALEARLDGGRLIRGIVKPDEEATREYQEALQNSQSAFLLEHTKPDIFQMKVGNLAPGKEVTVKITYVTEVALEGLNKDVNWRFTLPTTIAPRYIQDTDESEQGKRIGNIPYSKSSPAPLEINVIWSINSEITNVESATHTIIKNVIPAGESSINNKAVVKLQGLTTDMDRDFILKLKSADVNEPQIWLEKGATSAAAVACLVPEFDIVQQKADLVFLLDRSGSMRGLSITLAKKALELFIHSLPVDCYFNIVSFGNTYEFLFQENMKYNEESMKTALMYTADMDANLGGTEIFRPMKAIFEMKPVEGYIRQIFILTDGEVANTEQVIKLVASNAHRARVFSLGIGDSCSHYLVESIARAGGGSSAFTTYKENISPKVHKQLVNALQPAVADVELKWFIDSTEIRPSENMLQAPFKIPPVFSGTEMRVYGIWRNGKHANMVTISGKLPGGATKSFSASVTEKQTIQGSFIHKLAARRIIRDFEEEVSYLHGNGPEQEPSKEVIKRKIEELGVRYGIASLHTSFVAIDNEKQRKDDDDPWMMQSRHIPNQLAHGWGGGGMGYGGPLTRYGGGPSPMFGGGPSPMFAGGPPPMFGGGPPPMYSPMMMNRMVGGGGVPMRKMMRAKQQVLALNVVQSDGVPSAPTGGVPSAQHVACTDGEYIGYGDSMDTDDCYGEPVENLSADVIVEKIIAKQKFDGSFEPTEKLTTLFKLEWNVVQKAATDLGLDLKVWVTALALQYFALALKAKEEFWNLVSMKGTQWLDTATPDSQDTLKQAGEFLTKNGVKQLE